MPGKTFTMPTSLDDKLASADSHVQDQAEPNRSLALAKNETDTFSKEAKEPLATNKNPHSKPGITFAAQDKLPKLPIPDLDKSAKRYIAALEPLQSAREHADTKIAVQDFVRNEGPELQEKLKKYAQDKTSYIEQFCTFSIPLSAVSTTNVR